MKRIVHCSYLTLLIWLMWAFTTTAETITGRRQSCSNEGEEVKLDGAPFKTFKCFKCICQNGFVECEPESCPSIDGCYMLEKRPSDGCCQKCKECLYDGQWYPSGTEWSAPDDNCTVFKCEAGVVTETTQTCYTPCSNPVAPRPGQCCPTCLNCHLNGQPVEEGREVTLSEDPCLKCQCSNKRLTCVKKACPVLQCPISKQIKVPGECCPRCSERREILQIPGKCILGKGFHSNGKQFSPDHCTPCKCVNGTSICRRETCTVLECSLEYQKTNPGDCCPHCPSPEVRSTCEYNNQTYQNDETWEQGPCRSCRCSNGKFLCAQTKCPNVKCRPNELLVTPDGQCCAKCVESAGICTVFGDPHYKTFDGKYFSFQGACKYQLAADCRDHTFAIRVTNDGRLKNSTSRTKTVTLKIRGVRINLGQKNRVKINGSRISLPYELTNVVQINRSSEAIFVSTAVGVKIEWDGRSFLQVHVPSSYKNKLCGLCGNYNGLSRDDLLSRDGVGYSDAKIWKFANSWKVGGRKACSKRHYVKPRNCKTHPAWSFCDPLQKSHIFGNCDSHLNPENYFDACKQDMCDCPSGTCYCESFAAYAHECNRLGIEVPNWRRITGCSLDYQKNATRVAQPFDSRKQGKANHHESRQFHRNRKKVKRPDYFIRHVPKALLIQKHAGRTPPPIH